MERRARAWRQQLWSRVAGDRILELGIGTGKNLPFHPPGKTIIVRHLDRLTVRLAGAHLDRNTVDNVRAAGFGEIHGHDLVLDIVKWIEARRGLVRAPSDVAR